MIKIKKFGTFSGVFLPTFLTIIGVIFYLRLTWLVGNTGVLGALTIIVFAHLITISTSLSMTSITTNMKVEGGGAYYLISRSLGKEIGGSIGIPLYFSQVLSVSLYVLGFIESVQMIFPDANTKIVSIIVSLIVGIISVIGADLAIKAQYVVFAFILFSLFNIGISTNMDIVPQMRGTFSEGSFWQSFAIFFPAVTGILAGVSMSGDLKNPKKSIPKGTLIAIGVTFTIYVLMTFWIGTNVPREKLLEDGKVLLEITKFPLLIVGGIWAATLSSALGSMVAGPRTMQALAHDGVLPKIFAKGSGKNNEPRLASVVSFFIAFIFIITGNLDKVAPVITMFFLNTYGAINLVAGLESLVSNPSYRPSFKTPTIISFFGAIGSYVVMFLINPLATSVSITFIILIYVYLKKKGIEKTWGDLRQGIWASIARFSLLKLRFEKDDKKNWKPDVMVFSGQPQNREELVYVANLLCKGKGIITIVSYILGKVTNKIKTKDILERNLESYLIENEILAFPEVVVAESIQSAVVNAIQANGLGYMKPNSVLMGFRKKTDEVNDYIESLKSIVSLDKNLLLLHMNEEKTFGNKETIDVWWGGLESNGWLMINLAHVISLNEDWKGTKIRFLSIVTNNSEVENRRKNIEKLLEDSRVQGDVEIVLKDDEINAIIERESKDSDLVILGLANPMNFDSETYIENLSILTDKLPSTLFIKAVEM